MDRAFNMGGRFNSFVWNVFLCFLWKVDFSRFPFQLYTKFQFSGEGLTEPLPQTPPLLNSWASPSVRASIVLKSQALRALDSGFVCFGSPTFEAWLRPWTQTKAGIHSRSGVATIFGPPPTTCLGPWPRGYGDYFFLAGPGGPLQPRGPPPRGRGDCGALATPLHSRGIYVHWSWPSRSEYEPSSVTTEN